MADDKKTSDKNLSPEDLKQIQTLMGDKKNNFVQVDKMQPPAPKLPKKKTPAGKEAPVEDKKSTPPPFQVFSLEELNKKLKEVPQNERTFNDVFAGEKSDKFDPELNEYALKTVAEERGITVDELLQSEPDIKLEKKVEPMIEGTEPQEAAEPVQDAEADLDIEMEELELKKKELELKKRRAAKAAGVQIPESAPTSKIPRKGEDEIKKAKISDNPILQKMRQKLSIEQKETAIVEVLGIKFEMNEPPSSLYQWMYQKLDAAKAFQQESVFVMTLQHATLSAAIVRIDDTPAAEVLGLAKPGTIKDPYRMDVDLKILVAQTFWEMITGVNSIETAFTLDADVVQALYRAYQGKFRNKVITTSLDRDLHRFVCPVPGCTEIVDIKPNEKGEAYCRVHGVPMDDQGLTAELRAFPLV